MLTVRTGGKDAGTTARQLLAGTMPTGVLTGLTGAVLLVHLLLLQYTPVMLGMNDSARTRAFTTRSLQINVPSPQPAVVATPPKPTVPAQDVGSSVADKAPPLRDGAAEKAQRVAAAAAAAAAAATATAAASAASPGAAEPTPTGAAGSAIEPIASATKASASAASASYAPAAAAPATAASSSQAAVAIAATSATPSASSAPALLASPALPSPAPIASSATAALPKDGAQVARSYTVPGSVRLQFNATGQRGKLNYSAAGELLWLLRDDNSYEARMELSAFLIGARVLSSTGRMTADGLAPTRFSDKFRSEQAAHFERDKARITFSSNAPESVLLPGAQDQLSVFVQLASMIAGDPIKYPPGTAISTQTVGPRSAEPWIFTVEGEEKLHLPGGELTAVKLTRNARKEFDQKVEIWLAPALAYLPARIRITQANGDFVDQQWKSTGTP